MAIRSTSRSRAQRPVATIAGTIVVAMASISHALSVVPPSSSYSFWSSRGVMATTRRSSKTPSSLHYRDAPDEMMNDDVYDAKYQIIDVDDDDSDPLSRELRHDHFPDAAVWALAKAMLPNIELPSSWLKTSKAMENIVGGAGGAGILFHLNEAVSAYHHVGQVASSRGAIDDDALLTMMTNPHRRRQVSSPSSESTSSSTFADDVVETAKACVPVAVEFAAMAAIANYFD